MIIPRRIPTAPSSMCGATPAIGQNKFVQHIRTARAVERLSPLQPTAAYWSWERPAAAGYICIEGIRRWMDVMQGRRRLRLLLTGFLISGLLLACGEGGGGS